jgi:hypothetical protein
MLTGARQSTTGITVLRPGISDRLPLHVRSRVGSAAGERHDVILSTGLASGACPGYRKATAPATRSS